MFFWCKQSKEWFCYAVTEYAANSIITFSNTVVHTLAENVGAEVLIFSNRKLFIKEVRAYVLKA